MAYYYRLLTFLGVISLFVLSVTSQGKIFMLNLVFLVLSLFYKSKASVESTNQIAEKTYRFFVRGETVALEQKPLVEQSRESTFIQFHKFWGIMHSVVSGQHSMLSNNRTTLRRLS